MCHRIPRDEQRTFTHHFQVPSHCPVKYLKSWSFLNGKNKQEGDYRSK